VSDSDLSLINLQRISRQTLFLSNNIIRMSQEIYKGYMAHGELLQYLKHRLLSYLIEVRS